MTSSVPWRDSEHPAGCWLASGPDVAAVGSYSAGSSFPPRSRGWCGSGAPRATARWPAGSPGSRSPCTPWRGPGGPHRSRTQAVCSGTWPPPSSWPPRAALSAPCDLNIVITSFLCYTKSVVHCMGDSWSQQCYEVPTSRGWNEVKHFKICSLVYF